MIFKFWFRNGTYIEKALDIDTALLNDIEKHDWEILIKQFLDVTTEAFKEPNDVHGQITISGLVVRVDDLIAFEMVELNKEEN